MTDYYVSAAGNDTNSGSYSAPWKTLAKVNATSLKLKDRVLFRRGDTFYGKLRPPTNLSASSPGWLRYGAYGDNSAAPIISGYKIFNTAGGWTEHTSGVWKVDYAPANVDTTYTGNDATPENSQADIGILKVDGVIKSAKKGTLGALADQWDYYSTGTVLYVKSSGNPTTVAADIRGSIDLDGVYGRSCVEVADLTVEGFGSCGFYVARGGVVANRVRILRNTIREIGGSFLDNYNGAGGNGTTRYGNGIVIWDKSSNVLAEYNTISDAWDSAVTVQGGSTGQVGGFTNILMRRNLAYRCSQAEEYYYAGTGPGFVNCKSEYNTYLFMGYGWGGDARPDPAVRTGYATYPWGDDNTLAADLTLRRNIFYDIRTNYCFVGYLTDFANGTPPGLDADYNVIALRPTAKMQHSNAGHPLYDYTIATAPAWAAITGREQHSQFVALPSSNDTDISTADVNAALTSINALSRMGQVMGIAAGRKSL